MVCVICIDCTWLACLRISLRSYRPSLSLGWFAMTANSLGVYSRGLACPTCLGSLIRYLFFQDHFAWFAYFARLDYSAIGSLAPELATLVRTELLCSACLALLSLCVLLGLLCFGWFAKPALRSLAREARFAQMVHAWFARFTLFA